MRRGGDNGDDADEDEDDDDGGGGGDDNGTSQPSMHFGFSLWETLGGILTCMGRRPKASCMPFGVFLDAA